MYRCVDWETTSNRVNDPEDVTSAELALLESDIVRGRSTDGVSANNDVTSIKLWKGKK